METDAGLSLDAALADAWERLASGARDRHSGFHTAALATIAPDGSPRARTVVLRRADAAERVILVHADARSPKVAELSRDPRAAMVFYDAATRRQVRASGVVTLHAADELASAQWDASAEMSRLSYTGAVGTRAELSGPGDVQAGHGTGREVFMVLKLDVREVDWLHLHHAGHRRLIARWTGTRWDARWVAP